MFFRSNKPADWKIEVSLLNALQPNPKTPLYDPILIPAGFPRRNAQWLSLVPQEEKDEVAPLSSVTLRKRTP